MAAKQYIILFFSFGACLTSLNLKAQALLRIPAMEVPGNSGALLRSGVFNPVVPSRSVTTLPPHLSPVWLPKWTVESLPFFCRIEHGWTRQGSRLPLKFRLGSVAYVDWLEGKTDVFQPY